MVLAQCLLGAWWQQCRAGTLLNVSKISAFAAHHVHGPSPAFQTVILDRAWEHTEGLPTLRWWSKSVFPGFPEMRQYFLQETVAQPQYAANQTPQYAVPYHSYPFPYRVPVRPVQLRGRAGSRGCFLDLTLFVLWPLDPLGPRSLN